LYYYRNIFQGLHPTLGKRKNNRYGCQFYGNITRLFFNSIIN
jgi:hypothetical protein